MHINSSVECGGLLDCVEFTYAIKRELLSSLRVIHRTRNTGSSDLVSAVAVSFRNDI